MNEDWFEALKQNFQEVIEDKEYIAYYFETYKKRYRLNDQDIQNLLKIGQEQYFSLGLCKIPIWNKEPKTAEERFTNQVELIAKYIDCDPLILENFLSN